jgi:hypothetical protein
VKAEESRECTYIKLSRNLGEHGVCSGEIVLGLRNIRILLLCLSRLNRVVGVASKDITIDFVADFDGQ